MELTFMPVKETKGTWKFEEELPSSFAEPKIGTLYVRKGTLGELGFDVADHVLRVTIEVAPA